jgi:hypothetical protein
MRQPDLSTPVPFYLSEVLGIKSFATDVTAAPQPRIALTLFVGPTWGAAEQEVVGKMLGAISVALEDVQIQVADASTDAKPVDPTRIVLKFGALESNTASQTIGGKVFELPGLAEILGAETSAAAKKQAWQILKQVRAELDR